MKKVTDESIVRADGFCPTQWILYFEYSMKNTGFWRKLFPKQKNMETDNNNTNQKWMRCTNGHWYDNSVYDSCPYCIQDQRLGERTINTGRNRTEFFGDDDFEKDVFNRPSQNNQTCHRTVPYIRNERITVCHPPEMEKSGFSRFESNENDADIYDYKNMDGPDFVEIDYFPIGTSWRHFPWQKEKAVLFDVIEKDGAFYIPDNAKEVNLIYCGDSLVDHGSIQIKMDDGNWVFVKLRKDGRNTKVDEYFFDDSDMERCSFPTTIFFSELKLETGHYALFNSRTRKAVLIVFTFEEKSNIRTCPHCGGPMTVKHYTYEDQKSIFFGSILLPGLERDEYSCINCSFRGHAEYSHEINDISYIRNESKYRGTSFMA